MKKYIYISMLFLLFIGCEVDRCFKKVGDEKMLTEHYDSIAVLQIMGIFDVELVQDTVYYIEAIAPEEVLKGIDFEFDTNTLSCYNYNSCFWRHEFDRPLIRVHFLDLYDVDVYESSYLFSNDSITTSIRLSVRCGLAEADLVFNNETIQFYINKTSGGRYNFSGKTGYAYLINHNAGLYDMSELEAIAMRARNHSVVDMKVNVVDRLTVEIHNSGNVLYKGNPKIFYDSITSTGRPIAIN